MFSEFDYTIVNEATLDALLDEHDEVYADYWVYCKLLEEDDETSI